MSDVLLKSDRHPPRDLTPKCSAVGNYFKRNALPVEQRFIKVKRLASRGTVMDPWRVFFLDLLSFANIGCLPETHASAGM